MTLIAENSFRVKNDDIIKNVVLIEYKMSEVYFRHYRDIDKELHNRAINIIDNESKLKFLLLKIKQFGNKVCYFE